MRHFDSARKPGNRDSIRGMRISPVVVLAILATPAFAEPPVLPMPWVKLSEIYYTPTQVRLYGSGGVALNCGNQPCNAVYVQTHLPSGTNEGPQAQNTPITVDLTPFGVASDAKVAFLSGVLTITHGTTTETADLKITFAAADEGPMDCGKYLGQTIESAVGGGQRSNMATWVPLTSARFRFCYSLSTPGAWPANSSYAINLSLQAWGR